MWFTSLLFLIFSFLSSPVYILHLHHPPPPNTIRLFSSSLLTQCKGSGVLAVMWLFVWTQLPVFSIGWFSLKERWFPGWRGMAAPLHFSLQLPPPSPLHCSEPVSLSVTLSLPQAVLDQVAREHDTHRQGRGCVSSSSSPSSPFSAGRQSQRPLDCGRWVKQMALFVEI